MIIERFMRATTDARKLRNTPFNLYWSPLFGNTVYDENFDLKGSVPSFEKFLKKI